MQRLKFQRLLDFVWVDHQRRAEQDALDAQSQHTESRKKTPENLTMFQAFEWFVPADQKHWQRLSSALPRLKNIGIDNIWIPPGCKATNPMDNGYGIYDLYDLGEFDQKGSRPTKWGNREDLQRLLATAEELGVGVYWDTILNHKASADHTERCVAVTVDPKDRMRDITRPKEIEAWIGFDFPGRGGKYSAQNYHWNHFNATDYNSLDDKSAIYRIASKKWSQLVDAENGNYDYLMFSNLDHTHPEVRRDIKQWGEWLGRELKLKGLRLDAVKHYSDKFQLEFIEHLQRTVGSDWFFVAEYWLFSVEGMRAYLSRMKHKVSLFDSVLLYSFARISTTKDADLRRVLDDSLVQHEPANAVTLVTNHDTQPMQALAAPFLPWFKPHAYALILLRAAGYPCVFYGDLYGIADSPLHPQYEPPSCGGALPVLCLLRKLFAYGPQIDYFDAPACVGWTRLGSWDRRGGLAVLMSSGGKGRKRMLVGRGRGGEVWVDVLAKGKREVVIDAGGYGEFVCGPMEVAVWVWRDGPARERLEGTFDADTYR